MRYATTLIQMPLGLVPVAVPPRRFQPFPREQRRQLGRFSGDLRSRIAVITVLLIPATLGLWVLAVPVIALLSAWQLHPL